MSTKAALVLPALLLLLPSLPTSFILCSTLSLHIYITTPCADARKDTGDLCEMQETGRQYPIQVEKPESPEFIEDSKDNEILGGDGRDNDTLELESSQINEKKLMRRIDYHLIPWLALLYLLSFLDRTNIGNANVFGMSTDIGITSTQYSLCLMIFFVFYVICEVPSNMVMKAWRPSMWLPIIMIAWGAVMIGMGWVNNFASLFITRVFLGATEAGLFPGAAFFLTQWYRRYEINLRLSVFFSAATAAGCFGGLLARLINLMDGAAGLEGWRWIFILEGVATVVLAIASFWMLYDYPDTATFLSDAERAFVVRRLHLDNDGLSQEYKTKFIYDAFLDWKIYVFGLMFIFALTPVYSFSLFSPTLVANLGYTAGIAQLMSTPPYILAAITTLASGYYSDKYRMRAPIIMLCGATGALGFTLLICTGTPGVQYTGLFFAAAGGYPLIPLVATWSSNNMGGSLKKGTGVAMVTSFANMGGIISSFVYPRKDRPRYISGHAILLSFDVGVVVLAGFMWWWLRQANAKKAAIRAELKGDYTPEERAARSEDGDNVPWFVYAL